MDYIAKKAFQSKVSGFTGDAKSAFGMDGKDKDKGKSGDNSAARASLDRERNERKEKLEKKQAKRNEQRASDRNAMRAKYAIKGGNSDSYAGGDDGMRPTFHHGDESSKGGCCIIL